jgi:hypothetical protein
LVFDIRARRALQSGETACQRNRPSQEQDEQGQIHTISFFVEEGMAMLWRSVAAGALAAVVCWVPTAAAHAGDVLRLGLNSEAPTFNLKGDGGSEDTTTAWRGYRAGYYRGYYNGYYGGYYGSYYPRYYGSYYYPGYYGSYYYPSYSYGYSYYPRYYGSYYYPGYYGYSYYYPSYYGISYVSPINCPAGNQDVPGIVLTQGGAGTTDAYKPPATPDPMKPAPPDGTYPYDGGPPAPVPMPRVEPAPAGKVRPQTMPLEGRPVSLPPAAAPKKKYDYLAYGEKPAAEAAPDLPKRSFAQDRIVVLTADPARKAPR